MTSKGIKASSHRGIEGLGIRDQGSGIRDFRFQISDFRVSQVYSLKSQVCNRRGNTIVLVIGILVMLVIIATAYVSRTQAGRVVANAIQTVEMRDDVSSLISNQLATEISEALFVRFIDSTEVFAPRAVIPVASSNYPRLQLIPGAVRYGRGDPFMYNYAPFHVVPFTNWPDPHATDSSAVSEWPSGPANPAGGGFSILLAGEYNPLGDPGFGDTRWLRDLEPLRWDSWEDAPFLGTPGEDGILDAFSHWRHLTNLARPNNSFRVVTDISDIGDVVTVNPTDGSALSGSDGFGTLVTDLTIPIEQWLTHPPRNVFDGSGTPKPSGTSGFTSGHFTVVNFFEQWFDWFALDPDSDTTADRLEQYRTVYVFDPVTGGFNDIPANFYNLRDLDADNEILEVGERPQDEFIPGTWRWNVNRVLTDTDGDGFTDAFWFDPGMPAHNGVRHIVAVTIVDNHAMINANVATRFLRNDINEITGVFIPGTKTAGHTPADIALVGDYDGDRAAGVTEGRSSNWNVGFYDNPDHDWFPCPVGECAPAHKRTNFDYQIPDSAIGPDDPTNMANRWNRHLLEIGCTVPDSVTGDPLPILYLTQSDRLYFWQQCASRPLSADPFSVPSFTPFSLDDEVELRMFFGQNYPWIYSRYESSVQSEAAVTGEADNFLRAKRGFEESTEYRGQLYNRELVADSRHRITLYNNVRNETMPPWLWESPTVPMSEKWKLDLRSADWNFDNGFYGDDDNFDGVPDYPGDVGDLGDDAQLKTDTERLRDVLKRCLMDNLDGIDPPGAAADNVGTYYGPFNTPGGVTPKEWEIRELAAAYAANIRDHRDVDSDSTLAQAVEVEGFATAPPERKKKFLGIERQPFLTEAFIAHLYKPYSTQRNHLGLGPAGTEVFCEKSEYRNTIVVVQIANPFDRPIDLTGYKIRLFVPQTIPAPGTINVREVDLGAAGMGGALAPNSFRTYYAMEGPATLPSDTYPLFDPGQYELWHDHILKLDIANAFPVPADSNGDGTLYNEPDWSVDRGVYDGGDQSEKRAIEIVRDGGTTVDVVVDRIDIPSHTDYEFGETVTQMADPWRTECDLEPGPNLPWPEVQATSYDHWVQWVRVIRSWDYDVDDDGLITDNERSPRFVFADRKVIEQIAGDYYNDGPDPTVPDDQWDSGVRPLTTFHTTFKQSNPGETYGGEEIMVDVDNNGTAESVGRLRFSMQMMQKDGDFEQIGELLNVWLFGHKLRFDAAGAFDNGEPAGPRIVDGGTEITFSEFIGKGSGVADHYASVVGDDYSVNRLAVQPNSAFGFGFVIGIGDPSDFDDPRHAVPALPAGLRMLDAFVCDGAGLEPPLDYDFDGVTDTNGDGVSDDPDDYFFKELRARFGNAQGYEGKGTPGLININTAPIEVLQALPHWYRLVHEHGFGPSEVGTISTYQNHAGLDLVTDSTDADALLPRVMLPEALWHYRDRLNGRDPLDPSAPNPTGMPYGADYEDRSRIGVFSAIRGDRGLASIGEVMLLNLNGSTHTTPPGASIFKETADPTLTETIFPAHWRIDMDTMTGRIDTSVTPPVPYPPFDPFHHVDAIGESHMVSMQLSTDRNNPFDRDCDGIGGLDSAQIAANPLLDSNNDGYLDVCQSFTQRVPRREVSEDISGLGVVKNKVAGDAEESHLLFSGVSNLITTRSDTFTVYFRVRSFRQNTSVYPPRWDATNPDYIIDDRRYVMLVDRSEVNSPTDEPKILYLEKLPN